jgi:hypothetical protein
MYPLTSLDEVAYFFKHFRCSYCGSDAGYPSRPRNFVERYLAPLVLLRKVRCGDCYRREYRPLSVPLRKPRGRLVFDHEQAISTLTAPVRKEPGKETVDRSNSRQRIA